MKKIFMVVVLAVGFSSCASHKHEGASCGCSKDGEKKCACGATDSKDCKCH